MAGSGLENSNSKSEQSALNKMDESLEIIQNNHLWSKSRFKLRTVGAGGFLSGPEKEHRVGNWQWSKPHDVAKITSAKEPTTGLLRILFF